MLDSGLIPLLLALLLDLILGEDADLRRGGRCREAENGGDRWEAEAGEFRDVHNDWRQM